MKSQEIMKINANSDWTFFNTYHDDRYILSHDSRKTVVLKEPKESRVYRLNNQSGKELVVYTIDGGVITSDKVYKCDYGIYTEDNALYLVELKGREYLHALKQLLSTINILLISPGVKVNRLNARVVLSKARIPDIMPTDEKKLLAILKKNKGDFIRKCQLLEENI